MEQKKETNAQLQRRIKNAVIHIDKTKDTKSLFYDDKGLRLTVTEDKAIIATGFHQHVFDFYTTGGVSRPYLYTKRVIEITMEHEHECTVRDDKGNAVGHSYAMLLDALKAKEDKSEYNILYFYGWWLLVIFDGLYSIGESEVESFMVYFQYCAIIAKNAVLLSEKTEDMTNKQFIEKFIEHLKEFTDNMTESVLFHKKTDEETMRENIEAVQEQEFNEQVQSDENQG